MLLLFVLITFQPILDGVLKIWTNPEIQEWRTKMAAIQKWLRNYYVMWRHNLMMRTLKETYSDILSTLQVSLS